MPTLKIISLIVTNLIVSKSYKFGDILITVVSNIKYLAAASSRFIGNDFTVGVVGTAWS